MTRFLVLILLLSSCTNKKNTREVLEAEGYTDIRTTGYSPLACGTHDMSATGFTALAVSGRRVDGVVCCGMFKSCTTRVTRVHK